MVSAVEMLTPRMKRITFSTPEFANFESAAHDDHVKLFFQPDGGNALADAGSPGVSARDFTPRSFNRAQHTLTIDFALHVHGPATMWAHNARVGDPMLIGGPRGSLVVPDDFDWYLLIGDESALPAIGRRLQELRAAVPVTTVVTIADAADRQTLTTAADWRPHWIVRGAGSANDAALVMRTLDGIAFGSGDGFVWIAGETAVARAVRRYIMGPREHPAAWIKAAAYWTRGRAGEHEAIGDDTPT